MFFTQPKTAEECRRYALICEEQARLAPSPEARLEMLDLAREWRSLAEEMERSEK